MARELKQGEVERLFTEAVDGGLSVDDGEAFEAALATDPALAARYAQYTRALELLKKAPREQAPPALAGLILRRARRRRPSRTARFIEEYRVPVEVLVPILLAVAVAVFLLLSNP